MQSTNSEVKLVLCIYSLNLIHYLTGSQCTVYHSLYSGILGK